MSKLKILERLPREMKNDAKKLFKSSIDKWGHLPAAKTDIKVGEMIVVNWACAWNDPKDIGTVGMVIASNGYHSIIHIGRVLKNISVRTEFYRCEDLTPEGNFTKE